MNRKKFSVRVVSTFFCTLFLGMVSGFGEIVKIDSKATEAIMQSKAECVMEVNSRRILFESHGDVCLPMASTTKILTAITVLGEQTKLEEEIVIPKEAEGVEGSSVYLKSGDTYTVKDLLYGLMLRSGNDCATALALKFGGSIENFAKKMNLTAQKSGALTSNFVNPHGLPDKDHYTTARDLTMIACYAMQNPIFREIVATQYYAPRHWKNKNKMLTALEGAIGVKTGYTKEAGRCLVTALKREEMTLVCSVLNSPMMYERSIMLLEDAFKAYSYKKILSAEEPLDIDNGKKRVKGVSKKEFYYPLLKEEEDLIEIKTTPNYSKDEDERGKIIGQFEIYLAKQLLFSGNLYKL